ncbi:MAG: DUF4139 domain-containing protein [Phycisphaeraceae bacterium]|nr:DUF4139 domain-containing protein [Phycisphaeraceae bacterium]
MKRNILIAATLMLTVGASQAKVDLVTLPQRDTVQLTIYNSADLTLARESRGLVLTEGSNELQFSWENTLIDPTSLNMVPLERAGQIDVASLVFPPRVKNLGLWKVNSEVSGKVPVAISYLTSGLSWRAFYMGTLTPDEKAMRLQGYVRVTNNSGEDYENAQVRLVVGEVHLLDRIAELARRNEPYGRPGPGARQEKLGRVMEPRVMMKSLDVLSMASSAPMKREKAIEKKSLSEYFLYSIEGTETIAHGWSKRLISFDTAEIPVVNLYKFEEDRYGESVVRFLSYANDAEHKLGTTPIPGGQLKVYRETGTNANLSYTGQSAFKYIPVNEDVELNLGHASDVTVEPVLMTVARENFKLDRERNPDGFDDIQTYTVTLTNTRNIPVDVEIKRNFDTQYWTLTHQGFAGSYEREDLDTVKFMATLDPRSETKFDYTVRLYRGTRQENWREN